MGAQGRFRSDCAFVQSDQNLPWAPFGQPKIQPFFTWTMKSLTRLRGCTGGLESLLGASVGRYVCLRCDSNLFFFFPKIGFVVHLNLFLLFSKPVEINVKEYNGSYVKGHLLTTATSYNITFFDLPKCHCTI